MSYNLNELEYWCIDEHGKIQDENGDVVLDLNNADDQLKCLNVIKTLAENLSCVIHEEPKTLIHQMEKLINTNKDQILHHYDNIEIN